MADAAGQQVVLLSQVLASEVNIGYEEMLNTQVRQKLMAECCKPW